MSTSKVWLVIGANNGLGAAAIKYLVSKNQVTIALMIDENITCSFYCNEQHNLHIIKTNRFDIIEFNTLLQHIIANYGAINFIINNSNYQLFNMLNLKVDTEVQKDLYASIDETMSIMKELMPYFCKKPKGRIINIPPQFCLATLPNKSNAVMLSLAMDTFLKDMHKSLLSLGFPLSFLKPGERLSTLSYQE